MKNKVVVGLSGGVDSAVAAYLLKQKGYEIICVFMQNWDKLLNNDFSKSKFKHCDSRIDFKDCQNICKLLKLPLFYIDFVDQYWKKIFVPFLENLKKGKTPNPDILCNKYIKFSLFFNYCLTKFNANYIATGHYAKILKNGNEYKLTIPLDKKKDQTYFLASIDQNKLPKIIFPLANILKHDVYKIAKNLNLPVLDKKESTGICFIGERAFQQFLQNYLPIKKGNIINFDNNKIIGEHNGLWFYTIGQRKQLGIGGGIKPYYVCKKNILNNIIYVTNNKNNLFSDCCELNNMNWLVNLISIKFPLNCQVMFRYHQKKTNAIITKLEKNLFLVKYELIIAVTPGQYCVIYLDNICLGSGEIDNVFKNNIKI